MDLVAIEIVAELEPRDGWYRGDTEDTLTEVAENLLSEGCDEEVVRESLERVISAIREEYGE